MNAPLARSRAFAFADVAAALAALGKRLNAVGTERVAPSEAWGRVLAQPIVTDRPSPACDVSAMDGYAVRCADLRDGARLPVSGEATVGHVPPKLPAGHAMRIFTGGPLPDGADAVIRREVMDEAPTVVRLLIPAGDVRPNDNIRRRGENAPASTRVGEDGCAVTPPVAAALAAFGYSQVRVYRRVRVAILTTGDEVVGATEPPSEWQIRDSNGPALSALLHPIPWVLLQTARHVPDEPRALRDAVDAALNQADALLMTGGVSMGDHDHVPDVVRGAGCKVIFHRLPIRPGKPVLGAAGPAGQLVLGLPGNPVSVMVTARRLAIPALRRRAGLRRSDDRPAQVRVTNADARRLKLHWSRPVRRTGFDTVELLATQGSGDVVSTASSDGFVEIPSGAAGVGPWPFYSWSALS